MGAFLLISDREKRFKHSSALEIIRKQCGTEPLNFRLEGWNLYLFPKLLIPDLKNFRLTDNYSLFATGTPFLHGKTYQETLDKLFSYICREVQPEQIKGHFFILTDSPDGLRFFTDPSGIYSTYHTSGGTVISSSFLAIAEGTESLTVNRDPFIENLLTGSIIGSDTIFSEILRFEPAFPFKFHGLKFMPYSYGAEGIGPFRNRKESIDGQIKILDYYFAGIKRFAEEYGTDAGITGGFDSRLLLAMCLRHFDKEVLQFHSHRRKKPDSDFLSGEDICKKAGLKFVTKPVKDISDIDEEAALELVQNGMLVTDGPARTHSFWHEGFNTAGYRIGILGNRKLGLGGIGGEQYRNLERKFNCTYDLKNWIKNELIIKYSGFNSTGKDAIEKMVNTLTGKLEERIPLRKHGRIDYPGIKYYMQEVYIPANRGLKTGYENRLSFHLFPFTDPDVEYAARMAIPFLGVSLDYEAEIIRTLNPLIASVGSSYGYSFYGREPLQSVLPYIFLNNLVPGTVFQLIAEKFLSRKTDRWAILTGRLRPFRSMLEILNSAGFPVITDNLILRNDIGPVALALGHLLTRFRDKIKLP